MRVAPKVNVSDEQRQALRDLAKGHRTEVRVALRAEVVLAASTGLENTEIASELGVTRETVGRWRDRFIEAGVEGITKDLPRGGRKPTARARAEGHIIQVTTQQKPQNATHWSTRSLAEELGVTQSMVHRVLEGQRAEATPGEDFQGEQRSSL